MVWLCVLKLSVGCASVTASVCDCQSPCDMSSSLSSHVIPETDSVQNCADYVQRISKRENHLRLESLNDYTNQKEWGMIAGHDSLCIWAGDLV